MNKTSVHPLLKLNLGCGSYQINEWINVDIEPACDPDMVWNLEEFPWPWADNSVGEILMNHVLEHLGESRTVYLKIIQEIYRVCAPGSIVHIHVPHPRHDHYLSDPTHVRPITEEGLRVFDQSANREWESKNWANTPLGLYLGVDFRIRRCGYVLDPLFQGKIDRGEITWDDVNELVRTHNNVCQQIDIEWQCF